MGGEASSLRSRIEKTEPGVPTTDQVATVQIDGELTLVDSRFDLLGVIDLLDNLGKGVKDAITLELKNKGAGRVRGVKVGDNDKPLFSGYIRNTGATENIDPMKFVALIYERIQNGTITADQLASAIGSVKAGDAKKGDGAIAFLTGAEMRGLMVPARAASSSLCFDRGSGEVSDEQFVSLVRSLATMLGKQENLVVLRNETKKEVKSDGSKKVVARTATAKATK